MERRQKITMIMLTVIIFLITATAYAETIVIKGAGPSSNVVNAFLPLIGGGTSPKKSIKHKGGLEWSDTHLFGRTGRPCTVDELKGHAEIFLAKVPLVFGVSSYVNVKSITLKQLREIYEAKVTDWKEVRSGKSTPIVTIGREYTEAMYSSLKNEYPFFDFKQNPSIKFSLKRNKDHQVVGAIISGIMNEKGFIGFGALPNFKTQGITVLEIKGMKDIGVPLGLVYNIKNATHPFVALAKEKAKSAEWKAKIVEMGLIPME